MVVIFSETGARFLKPTTKLAEISDFLYPGNLSVSKRRYPNSEKKKLSPSNSQTMSAK